MRTAEINRKTAETDIILKIELDGKGQSDIDTGVGFLDHMLTLFAKHGRFDLQISCKGDTQVDDHHTTEDIGIALGEAFAKALGDKKGIVRYGSMILPMDEALILSAVDFSGRSFLAYEVGSQKESVKGLVDEEGFVMLEPARTPLAEKVGTFDTELVEEFWMGFTRKAECTLHIQQLAGKNTHHILEGIYKSVARSMRQAVAIEAAFADEIPSTKGML